MIPTLDLRAAAARPLELRGLHDISREEREAALTNWRMRMLSEHCSARVFAVLVEQLMRAGVASRHIHAVSAMIVQEMQHGELCARVVTALGGEAVAEIPELPRVPEHGDVSPIEAVLRNVISVSCMSETVAVALVGTERELAATKELHEILSQILSDEVKHARFGWSLLDELGPALDDAMRRRLDAYLVVAFSHQIDFHAPFLDMGRVGDRAIGLGAPDGSNNWQIFVDTIETVTLPGLERHGLRARRAWAEAVAMR